MLGQLVEVNGQKLHYEKVGTGKTVVLLLPGLMGSTRSDFPEQLDQLDPKKFTLIAWDPPGYGYSRAQERNYVKTVYVDDAHLAAAMMQVRPLEISREILFPPFDERQLGHRKLDRKAPGSQQGGGGRSTQSQCAPEPNRRAHFNIRWINYLFVCFLYRMVYQESSRVGEVTQVDFFCVRVCVVLLFFCSYLRPRQMPKRRRGHLESRPKLAIEIRAKQSLESCDRNRRADLASLPKTISPEQTDR